MSSPPTTFPTPTTSVNGAFTAELVGRRPVVKLSAPEGLKPSLLIGRRCRMCQQPRHSAVGPPGWFALACVGSWPSPGSSQPQWSVPAVVRSRHRSRPRRAHRQLHHLRVLEGIGTGERKRWPPRPRRVRSLEGGGSWPLRPEAKYGRGLPAPLLARPGTDRPSVSAVVHCCRWRLLLAWLPGRLQPGVLSGRPGDRLEAARDGHLPSPGRRLVLELCRTMKLTSVLPAALLRPTRE